MQTLIGWPAGFLMGAILVCFMIAFVHDSWTCPLVDPGEYAACITGPTRSHTGE